MNTGQKVATMVNKITKGQQWSTRGGTGQPESTRGNKGQKGSTMINKGQWWSTGVIKGYQGLKNGKISQQESTSIIKSQQTGGNMEQQRLARGNMGKHRPATRSNKA